MAGRFDELMAGLGTGAWSIGQIATLAYYFSVPAYQSMNGAFQAPKVDFACQEWSGGEAPLPHPPPSPPHPPPSPPPALNHTLAQEAANSTIYGSCSSVGEEEAACISYSFDNSTFVTTVTSEFGLVCSWEYLRALYTSIYMIGVFISSPLNGFLADKYGRKPLVVVGAVAYVLIAIGTTWLQNLTDILVARFLLGLLQPNTANTGYILAIENSEPRLRSALGIVLFMPWAFGEMVLGGLAYLIRDWRYLQLVTGLLGVVVLPAFWFLDESPRWLAVSGQHLKALKVLKRAAKWNKVELPPEEEIMSVMKTELPEVKDAPIKRDLKTIVIKSIDSTFILFKTTRLRLITVVMYGAYLVASMVYYGLSLSGGSLSDNPFLYMVLSGLMEMPAYTIAYPIIAKFGRRWPTVLSFLVSGGALFLIPVVPKGTAVVTLALLGKMSISISYQLIIFYSTELFPTEVRSRGVGTSFMLSRVGSISSPFITDILGTAYPWAPSIVFAATSVVAGLGVMALPETLGVALPDTIEQLEGQDYGPTSRGFIRIPLRRKRQEV